MSPARDCGMLMLRHSYVRISPEREGNKCKHAYLQCFQNKLQTNFIKLFDIVIWPINTLIEMLNDSKISQVVATLVTPDRLANVLLRQILNEV